MLRLIIIAASVSIIAGCATSYVGESGKPLTAAQCDERFSQDTVAESKKWIACSEASARYYSSLEPAWEPIESGSSINVNTANQYYPKEMRLSNGQILRNRDWKALQPILPSGHGQRDTVIDALSRFYFRYDEFEGVIKIEPLRAISGNYNATSYASVRGDLKSGKPENMRLELKYYGGDWIFADRVKVVTDGDAWESGKLNFLRDHTDNVWEYAFIPLDKAGLALARRIADADSAKVRFIGEQYYSDFAVTRAMKTDLGKMVAALEILER